VFPSITDDELGGEIFQMIFDEVSYRAKQAEEAGKQNEAQMLWKVIVEATE
jgi:hypothetical protein